MQQGEAITLNGPLHAALPTAFIWWRDLPAPSILPIGEVRAQQGSPQPIHISIHILMLAQFRQRRGGELEA